MLNSPVAFLVTALSIITFPTIAFSIFFVKEKKNSLPLL